MSHIDYKVSSEELRVWYEIYLEAMKRQRQMVANLMRPGRECESALSRLPFMTWEHFEARMLRVAEEEEGGTLPRFTGLRWFAGRFGIACPD